MLCRNKRGQIGETMTWMVATIIIIVILVISIFIVSSSLKSEKKLKVKNIKADLLVTKSLSSYLLNENNFNKLKTEGDFNKGNCESINEVLKLFIQKYPIERFAGVYENNKLINEESTCFEYSLLNYEGKIDLFGFWINFNLDNNKKFAAYVSGEIENVEN